MHPAFQVHMLNDLGKQKAENLASAFDALVTIISFDVLNNKNSRELSICITKLEEACFFAKKAMASNPENTI